VFVFHVIEYFMRTLPPPRVGNLTLKVEGNRMLTCTSVENHLQKGSDFNLRFWIVSSDFPNSSMMGRCTPKLRENGAR